MSNQVIISVTACIVWNVPTLATLNMYYAILLVMPPKYKLQVCSAHRTLHIPAGQLQFNTTKVKSVFSKPSVVQLPPF